MIMSLKVVFGLMFTIIVVFLLYVYWFLPYNTAEFFLKPQLGEQNNNFTLSPDSNIAMQFYNNMRYPSERISYKVENLCTLQKKDDMVAAFNVIESQTILDFYPVSFDEEIIVACENKIKIQERFFIAGEGGPTNITRTENFNVILHGGILLLRDSKCPKPNIAIHELLHALGFDHSSNPNNIMYNVSKCDQVIGDDIINTINEIYSVESEADLSFENVSAVMHGKYLDTNISIRNNGLMDSGEASIIIYVDEGIIKEIPLEEIRIGYGLTLNLGNIWVPKISVKEIKFEIKSSFEELNKNNNIIKLEIKNK